MPAQTLSFDHVHLLSTEPNATAAWYVEKLDASIVNRMEVKGAPQIFVKLGDATLIIRGQRPGETADEKSGLQWGVDHFGFGVSGDFDAYCDGLKAAGVVFTLDPTDANPSTRIAFISAPDRINIELLQRQSPSGG
jgi:lactoylglutathione lyase